MKRLLASLLYLTLGSTLVHSQSVLLPIADYGWLDQYSMNARHNLVGNDACVPTSTTNALTFLQNTYPEIYGTTLSGTGYSDWEDTDSALIGFMDTQAGQGTYDPQFVYGLQSYLTSISAAPIFLTGMFSDAGWGGSFPKPSFVTDGHPGVSFLFNALNTNSALVTTISYIGGGGHGILVNGLDWNSTTNTGTLYFIDPLNPSQNYSSTSPYPGDGPTLQTSGTLSLNVSGHLKLTYNQYQGGLPFSGGDFEIVEAVIDGGLALNPVPEPSALLLLLLAALAIARLRRNGQAGSQTVL